MKVVIADDQAVIREGLSLLLSTMDGVEVVGVAADGDEALALVAAHAPDVVLMDLRMPSVDGIEATRRIREHHVGTAVVVLTTYADDESIVGALKAGAIGYLTKDAGRASIQRALDAAASGQSVLDSEVQQRLVGIAALPSKGGPRLPDEITPKEREVLTLIAQGQSNADMADSLYVSRATIKTHVNHLLAKTGCRDRAQLVAYALERGVQR